LTPLWVAAICYNLLVVSWLLDRSNAAEESGVKPPRSIFTAFCCRA
jgi:hypothetical protein